MAANPRFSRTVLNVGGGTIVDIFTTSPAFASSLAALLQGLGIAPGTAAYVQFLQAAKSILDPADPVNFAGHLVGAPLPNLLANPNGSVAQAPNRPRPGGPLRQRRPERDRPRSSTATSGSSPSTRSRRPRLRGCSGT